MAAMTVKFEPSYRLYMHAVPNIYCVNRHYLRAQIEAHNTVHVLRVMHMSLLLVRQANNHVTSIVERRVLHEEGSSAREDELRVVLERVSDVIH